MNLVEEVSRLATRYALDHPSWRRGQCLFNALAELDIGLANKIRATEADPFYNDGNIPKFWLIFNRM